MDKKGLILIPFLTGYGGTETVIKNLLDEYNKEKNKYNINLKLYSLGGYINGDWLKFHNIKVFQFPKERYIREFLYLFLLPFLILYSIIKEKPNFIISTNPIMWTIAKLCSQFLHKDIKIVAWYHYSYKLKPVNRYCLSKSDYFLTISRAGKDELIRLGVSTNKIFVILNPIKPTNQIIKESKSHNQFIYVGRIEYSGQKNISELFKSLSLLKNKSWELRIYGTGKDKNKLITLSKLLHISHNIKWMGFVNNPFSKIKNADALILTSRYEGLPMVLMEALSRGLYVISSNCPSGPKELINSYNGKLYKPGHVTELSRILDNVINNKIKKGTYSDIKKSISKLYISKYFANLMYILNNIS